MHHTKFLGSYSLDYVRGAHVDDHENENQRGAGARQQLHQEEQYLTPQVQPQLQLLLRTVLLSTNLIQLP